MTDQPPYAQVDVGNRRRGRIGLALAVVAVVLAAAFGFSAFSGSGDGAGSAEGAVRSLFDALANEDGIGVLEALAPEERSVLRPAIEDINSELQRLGILNPVDLSKVAAVDISVDGLRLTSTAVADDISRVKLAGGTIAVTTKPGDVPTGDVLKNLIEATGGNTAVEQTTSTSELGQNADDYLVAVKRGGGWFVSLAFTIAEQARSADGRELPAVTDAVQPIGAASPDDAVRQFLDAAAALDVRSLIAHFPPDEMSALQRYASLFLPDVEGAVRQLKEDNDFSLTISDLQLERHDVDGGQLVQVRGGRFDVATGGGHFVFDSSDDCLLITPPPGEGEEQRVCPGTTLNRERATSPFEEALAQFTSRFKNAATGLVAVERDGGWYVSPLRTLTNVVLELVRSIDRADLERGGSLYRLITGER